MYQTNSFDQCLHNINICPYKDRFSSLVIALPDEQLTPESELCEQFVEPTVFIIGRHESKDVSVLSHLSSLSRILPTPSPK